MKPILLAIATLIALHSHAQTASKKERFAALIRDNFELARTQYLYMRSLTPPDKMPQSYNEKTGVFDARDIQWWCSGFYPGILWYVYEQTKDADIKQEAERSLQVIAPNQHYTGNHDLGFMMYCSFGNAYRLTNNEEYKKIILQSSASLVTRYRPEIKSIQSWDKNKYFNCPVIIDNMMNLEMLLWAAQHGGEQQFADVAITHANTTLSSHFRPDNSSWHLVDYDLSTGKILRKTTWQGAAECSSWSRGQAWALYGFTTMYRMTRNKKYLVQAQKIAAYLLQHPNMPADKVPYWDFSAPLIPFAQRDASAAAIMASTLLELAKYSAPQKQTYLLAAETMIETLSGEQYLSKPRENGGFLLRHGTGALPLNSEIDVPLIYGDYYFLEALKRYKDWYL